MNLFLLRHGIAVERGLPGDEGDSQRPLTPEGVDKMRRIAHAAKGLGLEFDLILSSPYRRAQQTAQTLAAFYKMEERLRLTENLIPGASPAALIDEIRENYAGAASPLLVGHAPDLGLLASVLLTGGGQAALTLKKGGLCKLSLDELRYARCAALEWLLTPRQMLSMVKK